MTDRRMFYAADPLAAYLVTRDGQVPGEGPEVVVHARRGGLPGGTAVEVRVLEDELRPGERAGQFVVPRMAITPERIGRAFQPWHVDVEPDEGMRWRGYVDEVYNLTLRNLLGAQTPGELERREANRVEARATRLREQPVAPTFDLDHLQAIHRQLFESVYPWAGEPRTVNMAKARVPFVSWEAIEEAGAEVAEQVRKHDRFVGAGREEFAGHMAGLYNEVNVIHPFREGNGRTQRLWLDDVARGAGYRFDWRAVRGADNDRASQAGREGDLGPLRAMMQRITSRLPEPDHGLDQTARDAHRAAFPDRQRSSGVAGSPHTQGDPARRAYPRQSPLGYER